MTIDVAPVGVEARPETVYAERQLLGCCLSGFRHLDELGINADDFDSPGHGQIWTAIVRVAEAGQRPTAETVRFALGAELRDPIILVDLLQQASPPMQAPYWAKIVGDAANLRALELIGYQVQQLAREGGPADETVEQARALIDTAPRRGRVAARTWADVEPAVIDRVENGVRQGRPTPWSDLDRLIHGLVGGRFYLVGGRPGEGKSVMAQNLATAAAKRHGAVLFASLEMSEEDLGIRMLADASGVPLDTLQNSNRMDDKAWQMVSDGRNRLADMRPTLTILDDPLLSMAQIEAAARDIARRQPLALVVIDYLQLVRPGSSKVSREEQVAAISRSCKKLARSLDVPLVALSQLNRDSLKRVDKRPTLGDFRESGGQEQDADVAILLALDKETGEVDVQVAKNRHGARGELTLELWGAHARMVQPSDRFRR